MLASLLTAGCAAALALVFAVSAAGKARDIAGFAGSLPYSVPALVPVAESGAALARHHRRLRVIAAGVCAGEALIAVLLVAAVLTGATTLGVLGLAAALIACVAFTLVVASMLRRAVRQPCHCFGARSGPVAAPDLARNILLVLLALTGLVAAMIGGEQAPGVLLWVAAGSGVTLGLVLIDLSGLLWLTEPVRPFGA